MGNVDITTGSYVMNGKLPEIDFAQNKTFLTIYNELILY